MKSQADQQETETAGSPLAAIIGSSNMSNPPTNPPTLVPGTTSQPTNECTDTLTGYHQPTVDSANENSGSATRNYCQPTDPPAIAPTLLPSTTSSQQRPSDAYRYPITCTQHVHPTVKAAVYPTDLIPVVTSQPARPPNRKGRSVSHRPDTGRDQPTNVPSDKCADTLTWHEKPTYESAWEPPEKSTDICC
jgi:hypothetical protein